MWESRVAPLSGVLFGVLLIAGFVVNPNTDFMLPEGDIVAYFEDSPLRIMTGAYLGLLAAAALVWFSASLYKSIRRIDDDGRLSLLAVSGGVFAAALVAAGGVATIAAAERVRVVGSIDPGVAAALFDIAGIALGNGAPIGLGVMIGAAGIAVLRTRSQSLSTAWVSLVIALGLISPYAWAVIAVAILWIAVVGIWIYRAETARMALETA
ncbi:MAG TPA: hypothetical protein VE569_05810 [Acidimicrobiia bacterium]|jgi:hypothetical protein|nr:hypothetical protein [Acidimicrobiia bacterium]